ncbi:proline dehydrogenase [Fusarium acuminatum]|uniref:Proline dehydrogenase n=1 Tax=Fusarium acuminatum TaxID=5515 RepID=A0ABZ2X9G8_9HYPO
MSRDWILRPSLAIIERIVKSKSLLLNADRNPLLNRLLRWTIYNHFCAGSNAEQVARSTALVKAMGYQGVILGYAKEFVIDPAEGKVCTDTSRYSSGCYKMIEEWKNGTLQTLQNLQPGDFLAVKLTGAGPICLDALQARQPTHHHIAKALEEICLATESRGCRLWIDAEQQILQVCLDEWTIELMRKYNRNKVLVYNTIQGYLKNARENTERHITLAAQEGWCLGLKLVRGAYIEHEVRSLIHTTKEDTDRSYDDIADMLISQRLPSKATGQEFPCSALFLASHNAASVWKAIAMYNRRWESGLLTTGLECGQIIGMADELSCELIDNYQRCVTSKGLTTTTAPGVYKFLAWGSVSECMGYLHRRAIENRGAIERTNHMIVALKKEFYRRIFG